MLCKPFSSGLLKQFTATLISSENVTQLPFIEIHIYSPKRDADIDSTNYSIHTTAHVG